MRACLDSVSDLHKTYGLLPSLKLGIERGLIINEERASSSFIFVNNTINFPLIDLTILKI